MSTPWAYAGWTALLVGAVVVFILLRKRGTSDAQPPSHLQAPDYRPNIDTDIPASAPDATDPLQEDLTATASTTTDQPRAETATAPHTTDSPAAATEIGESTTDTNDHEDHPDTVLVEASEPRNVFDLDFTVRSLRLELWASRWMLGDDACAELSEALETAHARTASCLSDTIVEGETLTHCPPDCARLNSTIADVEAVARPLRSLRATKYQHALAAVRAHTDIDVNPHRAAIRAEHAVSPDPTHGLHRLVSEVSYGLEDARLSLARVAPTAGSAQSQQLRHALTCATEAVNSVNDQLRSLTVTPDHTAASSATSDQLLALENTACHAVWWRNFIDTTVTYLTAREWAHTSDDRHEWRGVAILALARASMIIDLFPRDIPAQFLTRLGRYRVLVDADAASITTYRSIVEDAQAVVDLLVVIPDSNR